MADKNRKSDKAGEKLSKRVEITVGKGEIAHHKCFVVLLQLLNKHPDALIAGSPYPDAYYSAICRGGQYHDVSEDTHWAGFLNATVNYIQRKYPQPWDEV